MADVIDHKIHGDDMQIVEIELDPGEGIRAEAGAMMFMEEGIEIEVAFTKKIGTGLFGGEGFILQRLEGHGMAFVHAGGTIIK